MNRELPAFVPSGRFLRPFLSHYKPAPHWFQRIPQKVALAMGSVGIGLASVLGCLPLAGSLVDNGLGLVFNESDLAPSVIAAEGEPVFSRESLFEAIPGRSGSHAATITAFSDGELLVAWYSYVGPEELDGAAIYMSRRPAGGAWTEPWLHMDRPIAEGNPVLYSEQDRVWLFQAVTPGGWSLASIEVQRSLDRGGAWSSPVGIGGPVGSNVRFPPIRTAAGDLLLPAYNDLTPQAEFYASADGEQWGFLGVVDRGGIQPSIARLSDGSLRAVMRNAGGGDWLWVMGSWDSGQSWSEPRDAGFPNPGSAAALAALGNGHLLLVFNDSPDSRVPLTAALSADGGMTWPARKNIAEGGSSYSYPSIVQTADGLIHVVFSVGRDHIDHAVFNEAWLVQP